ncbi:MAG: hypothetical protein OSJ65_00400 [Bacilli bacterium]|nr:hypothetical protein [Bacilli bacterium]
MKIDLFKLNNYNYLDIDEFVDFPSDFYQNMDVREIKDVKVTGTISINNLDEIETNLEVSGTFILPCAITLEDVLYDFKTNIEEILGNFNDFYLKNKNTLDILTFLWENIVSEVPMRVVKEGISVTKTYGDGWELVSE